MNVLGLITAILQAAPEELALVEVLINIAKGTHTVVPVATPQTVTAAPVVPETAVPEVPANGKKVVLT